MYGLIIPTLTVNEKQTRTVGSTLGRSYMLTERRMSLCQYPKHNSLLFHDYFGNRSMAPSHLYLTL